MKIDPLALIGANLRDQVENYLDQLPPLMMWGDFIFQLDTMAYKQLTTQESWNWAAQSRFGRADRLQYTGKKRQTIKFDCEIYAHLVNQTLLTLVLKKQGVVNEVSIDPVKALRLQANSKIPQMLVTGTGEVKGFWVMTDISQQIDAFKLDSAPKHQNVTLTLQYYGARLNQDQAVPDSASTGFTTKESKIKSAVADMKSFLEKYI